MLFKIMIKHKNWIGLIDEVVISKTNYFNICHFRTYFNQQENTKLFAYIEIFISQNHFFCLNLNFLFVLCIYTLVDLIV